MDTIEILTIDDKQYVSQKDAARYLDCSRHKLMMYTDLELLLMTRIGSRQFIEWQALQKFAREYLKKEATT